MRQGKRHWLHNTTSVYLRLVLSELSPPNVGFAACSVQ